jgi:hypothetical protein
VRIAYADPPYLGCCALYDHHHESPYSCWDLIDTHQLLIENLAQYDGWVLHGTSSSLKYLAPLLPDDARIMAWTKPFAAFKRNVSVAYAWEPVIVKAARKPEVTGREVMRDFVSESITLKRGFMGAKPERVCTWAFEIVGAYGDDELIDLFPGSGAVERAWKKWQMRLPLDCLT